MELGTPIPQHCHIEIAAREFWVIDDKGFPIDRLTLPEKKAITFNTEIGKNGSEKRRDG